MNRFFNENRNVIICMGIALVVVLFILMIGFFQTLLVAVFLLAGYLIGRSLDKGESLMQTVYFFFRKLFYRG